MDEQFDKDLKEHISRVFDNFEDTGADEGWLLLREKFPEKEKDRGIFWLWFGSAAAILLIILGIGIWVNLPNEKPKLVTYKPFKGAPHESVTANKVDKAPKQQKDTNRVAAYATQNQQPYTNQVSANTAESRHSKAAVNASIKNNAQLITKTYHPAKNPVADSVSKPEYNKAIAKNSAYDNAVNKALNSNNNNIASNPKTTNLNATDTAAKKDMVATIKKPKPSLFTDDGNTISKYKQPTQKDEPSKKVEFSVYAATYFNYAKGSNNQLNIGAGVGADFRLTENLKISTGVSIAQNNLSYTDQPPVVATQSFIATSNRTAATAVSGYSNLSSTSTSVNFKSYDAQLVGLDIPVNLKYEFSPQKSSSYVAVGLSSGTFITQSYTYQYAYNAGSYFLSSSQTQAQSSNNSLGSFYFAKTLNVSFGVGYPLGKNQLIIEPFLKYPLQGLGEQQIRFGAGGINLKFDLQRSKK